MLSLTAVVLAAGCSGPATGQPAGPREAEGAARPAARKAITIALPAEISALATALEARAVVSWINLQVQPFFNAYVTARDDQDEVRPDLATELPSVEAGTWKVLDDGRMEVTWKLRRGVRWHDGAEFTAHDLVFAWQVARDPATAAIQDTGVVVRLVEAIDAPDPYTAVLRWKEPSQFGGELGRSQLDPLPRHILEEAFQRDRDSFLAHPWFTDPGTFVGAGPFRPTAWERGSHLTGAAFDGYFLGRPKIDQVTIRFIYDAQTAMTNVLSGAVDFSNYAVSYEGARIIEQEWKASDGGRVMIPPTYFSFLLPQFRPEYAAPSDLLNRDVRRALIHSVDRQQLTDAAFPGAPQMFADSLALPGTPIGDAVTPQLVRYPYDPARAAALLEAAGWRRGGDGTLTKGGQRFQVELRSRQSGELDAIFPVMQQHLRQVGVDLTVMAMVRETPQDRVQYPGLLRSALAINGPNFGARWHGRHVPTSENRYTGANFSAYANPNLDRILDDLDRSVRREDQLRRWAEAWRIISEDVAMLPLHYYSTIYTLRKTLKVPLPRSALGSMTWQLHTWDVG